MSTSFFTATPARAKLATGEDHEIHAIFSFRPPAMANIDKRPPLDIAVAMDTSGSMHGSKIDNAKRSLGKLVEHLNDQDRLSIVTFESQVDTAFAPDLMTAQAKRQAQEQIDRMRAGSMTNLSGGLIKSLAFLKESAPSGTVRRCLVFTDGQPTAGVSDPEALVGIATEHRSGIGISTFGYGRDHNPDLLTALALDGNFHYIDTPEKILAAFGQELGGLISTFAQNMRITLTPGDGVEIVEVLNDVKVEQKDGVAHIEYDDLLAEQEQHIVVRLKVTKRANAHPRGIKLVTAHASYFDLNQKKDTTATAALKVKFVAAAKADTKDNMVVVEEVVLQQAVKVQTEAMHLADAGDYGGAAQVLAAASADYASRGSSAKSELIGRLVGTYGSRQKYAAGFGNTRAVQNVMRKRKAGKGTEIDGVDIAPGYSNTIQDQMEAAFINAVEPEADDPKDDPASDPKDSSGGDSASKGRSGSRW